MPQTMYGDDGPTVDPILKLHRARGKNAYVAVVTMKSVTENGKSRLVPTNDCAIPVSDLDNVFPEFKEAVDQLDADNQWFYSINSFYKARPGPGRGIAGLPRALRKKWAASYLTCLFCDIDGYNVGLDFGNLLGRIVNLQDAGKFPPASIIKRSGQGAWLYWLLKDRPDTDQPPTAHAHRQVMWSLLQREINERLSEIGADIGAKNVSRITRFPGSYNPKSGLRVVYWFQGDEDGKGFMYTMEQMADLLGVVIEEPQRRDGERKRSGTKNPGAADAVTLRLRDFQILRDMRGGGFDDGCRNIACTIYTWLLCVKGFRPDVVRKEATRLGRACRPALEQQRINLDIQSGIDMAKHPRKAEAGMRDVVIAAKLKGHPGPGSRTPPLLEGRPARGRQARHRHPVPAPRPDPRHPRRRRPAPTVLLRRPDHAPVPRHQGNEDDGLQGHEPDLWPAQARLRAVAPLGGHRLRGIRASTGGDVTHVVKVLLVLCTCVTFSLTLFK